MGRWSVKFSVGLNTTFMDLNATMDVQNTAGSPRMHRARVSGQLTNSVQSATLTEQEHDQAGDEVQEEQVALED